MDVDAFVGFSSLKMIVRKGIEILGFSFFLICGVEFQRSFRS